MATDIKISELNEITQNSDINQIIVNDRESAGDSGITKRINLDNFLTASLVKTRNIADLNVTTDKLDTGAVTFDKIANKSITCNQIADETICNGLIEDSAINNRTLDNNGDFTVSRLVATTSLQAPQVAATSKLTVDNGCVKLNGLDYEFPSTQVPQHFLRTDGAGNLSWEEAAPGAGTALVFDQIFPVGTIIPYGGSAAVPNDQWIALDGSNNSRFDGVAYPELSAALGTTWGARYTSESGSTTSSTGRYFSLPNMSGRVPIGQGTGTDNAGTTCSFGMGSTTGLYCQTLNANNIPSHTHCYRNDYFIEIHNSQKCVDYIENVGSGLFGSGRSDSDNIYVYGRCCTTAQNSTSNSAFSIVQPVASTRYIIKAKPDHIQQFGMAVGVGLSALDGAGAQTNTIDLSSTELGIKIDHNQLQFSGSNEIQLKTNTVLTDTEFVRVNGATNPLVHDERTTCGVVKEYCLCDFTDAGGILDATTRCDIRGVVMTYNVFNGQNVIANRFSEVLVNTDNGGVDAGYDVVGRYSSQNGDDDGGSGAMTTIPLNKDLTSFCFKYNVNPHKCNYAQTRILGVIINKYA